jgi:hypothetical protein
MNDMILAAIGSSKVDVCLELIVYDQQQSFKQRMIQ